jgi:DNA repair exonuclease SbcCD nuclease subunit
MATSSDFAGLLCIGDPHLASRVPGFRKDDYPQTALRKLRWCLRHARENRLLAVLLGDLFHYPRDNANWLVVEVMALLGEHEHTGGGPVLAVWGNHDCSENCLVPDDTLSVVLASGRLRLVYESDPWLGTVNGIPVAIGGTCWGRELPAAIDRAALAGDGRDSPARVVWLAHHDLRIPGAPMSTGRLGCREIPGVDLVVNGHIHYRLAAAATGATTWVNPGNISRVDRAAVTRAHVPSVLRIDFDDGAGWRTNYVSVPHEPFDEVFHPKAGDDDAWSMADGGESPFVQGLKELQSLKTAEGAGLRQFLEQNLARFDSRVAGEVRKLAQEVLGDADRTEPNEVR